MDDSRSVSERLLDTILKQEQEMIENIALRIFLVTVVDFYGRQAKYQLGETQSIYELKNYILDNVKTSYYTNYYLETAEGFRVVESEPISQLITPSEGPAEQTSGIRKFKLFMKTENYSERDVRNHISRFKNLLAQPPLDQNPIYQSESSFEDQVEQLTKQVKSESEEASPASASTKEQSKTPAEDEEAKARDATSEPSLSERAVMDYYSKFRNPDDIRLHENMKLAFYFDTPTGQGLSIPPFRKCIQSLEYSHFNPVKPTRAMRGDLLYLKGKTLENQVLHITACTRGFFLNNSYDPDHFDPTPKAKGSFFSPTIVDLLAKASPKFKENFKLHLESGKDIDPILAVQSPIPTQKWLVKESDIGVEKTLLSKQSSDIGLIHPLSMSSLPSFQDDSTQGLYGFDPKGLRDWNEEYQICKTAIIDIPDGEIHRERGMFKTYQEFVTSAISAGCAIIQGNIPALNPFERNREQRVFLYNNIFFSFAVDDYLHFTHYMPEQNPSHSAVSYDILALNKINKQSVKGLQTIITVLIDYMGSRIIAQSMIPGILHTDQNSDNTRYGSIDDGKRIKHDPQFDTLFREQNELLFIKDSTLVDEEGNKVRISGCRDTKGIQGTDNRKYMLDIHRFTPRDLNYPTEVYVQDIHGDNLSACVRPELLDFFHYHKVKKEAHARQVKYLVEEHERKKEQKLKEQEHKEEESKESQQKEILEKLEQRKQFEEKMNEILKETEKEIPRIKYNINLFTHIKTHYEDEKELEQDIQNIKDLAIFLQDTAIPEMLESIQNEEKEVYDSDSLADLMHNYGINMRYLGAVIARIDALNKAKYARAICERSVYSRSVKHVANKYIKNVDKEHLAPVVAHFLNLALSPDALAQRLDSRAVVFESAPQRSEQSAGGMAVEQPEQSSSKKSQKRKGKKNKNHPTPASTAPSSSPAPMITTPQVLFTRPNSLSKNTENITSYQEDALFGETRLQSSSSLQSLPECLKMLPEEFWKEVSECAKARYGYELPSRASFEPLSEISNRLPTLRQICLKLGIQIKNREYSWITAEQEDPEYIDSYSGMIFQDTDVVAVTPVPKMMEIGSPEISSFKKLAFEQLREMKLIESMNTYRVCIQFLVQIYGPYHPQIAECYEQIAFIHHSHQDNANAITIQEKVIVIYERCLGFDHFRTLRALKKFTDMVLSVSNLEQGYGILLRTIYVVKLIAGNNHPDLAWLFRRTGILHYLQRRFQRSVDLFLEAADRHANLFGKENTFVADCFRYVAFCYHELNDERNYEQYKKNTLQIIKKVSSDPKRLEETKLMFDRVEYPKKKENQIQRLIESQMAGNPRFGAITRPRPFGQNKPYQRGATRLSQQYNQRRLISELARLRNMQQVSGDGKMTAKQKQKKNTEESAEQS